MKKILSFIGTRPEVIKMAPVAHAFSDCADSRIVHRLCNTGQHRDLVRPLLDWFSLEADYSLDLMTENQNLASFTSRALEAIDRVLEQVRPELVLCQGDTTTAMAVGLAAFYRRIPVGHIEAGLRTHNRFAPFPEEVNRCIIDLVADYCFAPTDRAARELLKTGVPEERVLITGNTAIDALFWTLERIRTTGLEFLQPPAIVRPFLRAVSNQTLALVTAHRRESFGNGIAQIAAAVKLLAREFPDIHWIWPVHPNPNVRGPIEEILHGERRIHLLEPLDYPVFCCLLTRCSLVLTDSGGLQEECPTLGIPVFVMRDISERPEGIEAGNAILAGTNDQTIVQSVHRFFADEDLRRKMSTRRPVYGDGMARYRILEVCLQQSVHPTTGKDRLS